MLHRLCRAMSVARKDDVEDEDIDYEEGDEEMGEEVGSARAFRKRLYVFMEARTVWGRRFEAFIMLVIIITVTQVGHLLLSCVVLLVLYFIVDVAIRLQLFSRGFVGNICSILNSSTSCRLLLHYHGFLFVTYYRPFLINGINIIISGILTPPRGRR